LRENDGQNKTYRLVYIAAFDEAVYVLHVFNKKSTQGIATPRKDQALIEERFAEAKRLHEARSKR
jgi:phage-related protein